MFVTQRVREDKGIEAAILHWSDPVALTGTRSDPRRDREHDVSGCLEMLDKHSFGPFDRHRQPIREPYEFAVQLGQPGHVMRDSDFALLDTAMVNTTWRFSRT